MTMNHARTRSLTFYVLATALGLLALATSLLPDVAAALGQPTGLVLAMAALADTHPTLLDFARRLDPDKKVDKIVEIMNAENPMLEDLVFVEGNLPTGHKTTVRSGLPTPTWRKLNYGVQPTKSRTVQVQDSCGMLEVYAEVDAALAELNGNAPAWRLSEDRAHIEGMAQELAQTLIYGNEGTEPEAFTGLAPRFNSLAAENADNIVNAAGNDANSNTSIWLCIFGETTGHGIFPKGSRAGLQQEDKGRVTAENFDGNGGRAEIYRSHYRQDMGFVMRDWRYFVRIANIKVSDLNTLANTKNLITWMIQASERIPNFNKGRGAWYVNRTIREKLRLGILEKVATNLTWETVEGRRVMTFDDIPVRRMDAIVNNEALVA